MWAWLKALFGMTQAVSTEVTQRDAELNTAAERSNAEAAQIQTDRDRAAAEIAAKDQTALDRDVAP